MIVSRRFLYAALATSCLTFATAGKLCAQIDYGAYNMILKDDLVLSGNRNVHINSATLVGGDLLLRQGMNDYEFAVHKKDQFTAGVNLGLTVLGKVGTTTTPVSSSTTAYVQNAKYYFANNTVNNGQVWDGASNTQISISNSAGSTGTDPLKGGASFVFSQFDKLSAQYAAHATTASYNGVNFSAGSDAISFINLTGNEAGLFATKVGNTYTMNAAWMQFFNLDSSHKLVINLKLDANSTLNFASTYGSGNEQMAKNLLWNITGATTVNFNNNFGYYGSVLATGSNLIYNTGFNMYGQIIANSFTYSYSPVGSATEFHAENAFFFTNDMMPPIPEPSTYGMMGAGALAGLAFWRRRRATVKRAA